MKTTIELLAGAGGAGRVALALLLLAHAGQPALGGSANPATKRAIPFEEKGATRLAAFPPPERLPSELINPELAPLHTDWIRLQPEVFRLATVRSNRTVHIAVHQLNRNPGCPVLVMIHGVLSDYAAWVYIAPQLTADHEVWLVDLPGCGESDAPQPGAIEPDGYSPTAMAERILLALEQRLKAEGWARPVRLVGHSLGGTVCIRMVSAPDLLQRHQTIASHIERLVLLAPVDQTINSAPQQFLDLTDLTGLKMTIGRALGVVDSKIRELTKSNYPRPGFATREQAAHTAHALKDAAHRDAARAMVREFVPFDLKTRRPIWGEMDLLVADYRNISVPVLVVHGTRDETISVAGSHKLKNQIPGAALVEIAGSGHCLPTEQPVRCTDLIRQFMADGALRELHEPGMTLYPATVPAVQFVGRPLAEDEPTGEPTVIPSPELEMETLGIGGTKTASAPPGTPARKTTVALKP
jgi:pimeloyl-ACP methyl ester carboxylesterase